MDTAAGPPAARVAGLLTRHFTLVTAITLAFTGLLSAWATYQSGLWDKRETEARAAANARLTEASEQMLRAGQEQAMNTAMFLQWIEALADGQPLRAEVLEAHFPGAFVPAFNRWRAAQPHDLRRAEPDGILPDFSGPSLADARASRAQSRDLIAVAHSHGRVRDTYDLANVMLATSLFLAGIAAALPPHAARGLPLVLAICLTIGTAVVMTLAPTELPSGALPSQL